MSRAQESTKALASAQQAVTTGLSFQISRNAGNALLAVQEGQPVAEALRLSSQLLDGVSCLLRQINDDVEGELQGLEILALQMVIDVATNINVACVRGLERAGGAE
ncbi:hypothetical protein [Pseudomonas nicosulfuronedens]